MTDKNLVLYVTIGLIVAVLAFRIFRMTREQKMNPVTMWIAPGLFVVLAGALIVFDGLTSPGDIALTLVALLAGGAIGWYQGTHTTVRVDRAAKAIFVKVSPIGTAIFVAVLLMRFGVRYVTGGTAPVGAATASASTTAASHAAGPAALISVLALVVALGMVAGLRAYLQRAYAQAG